MKYIIERLTPFGWVAYGYAGSIQEAKKTIERVRSERGQECRFTDRKEYFQRFKEMTA